jgi:hypothetical protein
MSKWVLIIAMIEDRKELALPFRTTRQLARNHDFEVTESLQKVSGQRQHQQSSYTLVDETSNASI